MKKTRFFSYSSGSLPKGCQQCVRGEKLVVFITGFCPRKCFFCPVSEKKWGRDVVFADEWPVANKKKPVELIKEAEAIKAKGAGFTGGDPLVVLDRTCRYIRLLKKRFGKKFHIHLYTSLDLVTKDKLKRLFDAGLDEIRFHPDLDDEKFWDRISLAGNFNWDVGVEIPVIPGKEKETMKLINFIADKVKFLNLNELELSSTLTEHYSLDKFFHAKNDASYAVEGSLELGLKLGRFAEKKGLKVHVCTVKLKDAVQLKNRILRRAKNVRKKFELVTEEGTLVKGCIFLDGLKPGFGPKKVSSDEKKGILSRLRKARIKLIKALQVSNDLLLIDTKKLRLVTSPLLVDDFKDVIKGLGFSCAVVEEYPTRDELTVDVRFL